MATWEELIDHLRRRTRLSRDSAERCDFMVRAGGYPRRAVVRRLGGGLGVALSVDLYRASQLPDSAALVENLRARLGAFAREGDRYILRAVLPLAPLPVSALDLAIETLVRETAELLQANRARRLRPQRWFAAVDMYAS